MEFTISRKTWLRGEGLDSALLRERDGKMCCLGFRAIAAGHSASEIRGRLTPWELSKNYPWKRFVRAGDVTKACEAIMNINDARAITDSTREPKLTRLFAKLGDTVTFVD